MTSEARSTEPRAGAPKAPGPAPRLDAVQTPIIPVVGELVRDHPGTISLGQGVTHYPPPPEALARVAAALGEPATHRYGHVAGLPPLLERIREKLARDNGIALREGEEVVVTAGGNMAFMLALQAIADPGDEIILLAPYYFNHEMAVGIAGCRAVVVPTDADYQPDVEAIRAACTPRTRAVVTVSPNNPTGAVYGEQTLRAISALCREQGVFHISDEAYEYFTFEGARHFSPAAIEGAGRHTITLHSLSKAYGMAGWRMGYLLLPGQLLPVVKKIQDTLLIAPPIASQLAALGALEVGPAYCRQFLEPMARVRAVVREALAGLGELLTVPPAPGAFYFFPRLHAAVDDLALVRRLVTRYGVAVIPGSTFGAGGCYLRLSYGALDEENARIAMDRLASGLRGILGGEGE